MMNQTLRRRDASVVTHDNEVLPAKEKSKALQEETDITSTDLSSSGDDEEYEQNNDYKKSKNIGLKIQDKTVVEKLFSSKEESHYLHVHKILGISALVSFLYRYAHIGERDGNFGPNWHTLLFIIHHFLLNATSFIFRIPQRRINDGGGFRIWPEYRIHSLVFTSRSLACMLLIWSEQKTNSVGQHHFLDTVIVLATCAAADYGSSLQGEHRSSTVRGTTYTDPYGKWFASEMQFQLSAICLVGMRRYTLHLTAVTVIQVNSFLMTLRRKNVASHEVLTGAYGLLLIGAFWIGAADDDYNDMMLVSGTYGSLATILRMGPLHMNKYALWTLLGASLWFLRTYGWVEVENSRFWCIAFAATKFYSSYLGLKKRSKEIEEGQSAALVYVVIGSHLLLAGYIYYLNFVVEYDDY